MARGLIKRASRRGEFEKLGEACAATVLEKLAWMDGFNPLGGMSGGGGRPQDFGMQDQLVAQRQRMMQQSMNAVTPPTPPTPPTPSALGEAAGEAAHLPKGPTSPNLSAPKKGFLGKWGGRLGLIAGVGLPLASFFGHQLFGHDPTPEEEGYAPQRYV